MPLTPATRLGLYEIIAPLGAGGMGAEVLWKDPGRDEECRAWARAAMADVQPYESGGLYVNDVAEVGDDVARSVYGDVKYARLVALKRTWDPENAFRLNQNVRP